MTRTARPNLATPRLESQATPSRGTTRASQAFTLADLCSDAAGGHPSQRLTIARTTGGTFHGFYQASTARYLAIRVLVTRLGTWVPFDGVTLTLALDDGTTTIPNTNAAIPAGLNSTRPVTHRPGTALAGSRFASGGLSTMYLDVAALVTAGLDPTVPWRLTFVVTSGATAQCELLQLEEVPRYSTDTAEAYGQALGDYLPRQAIVAGDRGVQRLWATLRYGYTSQLRTYVAISAAEAAPLNTNFVVFVAMAGDQESAGVPITRAVRVRSMRGTTEARVRWRVRYRIVGAGVGATATVRMKTGAAGSPYDALLNDVTGLWADGPVKVAALKPGGDLYDAVLFEALVTPGAPPGGSLEVSTITVWDYPL